jgi:hypothetical protein
LRIPWLLLLGAIVNVAVAWGIALQANDGIDYPQPSGAYGNYVGSSNIEGWDRDCIYVDRTRGSVAIQVSGCPMCGLAASMYKPLDQAAFEQVVPKWSTVRTREALAARMAAIDQYGATLNEFASGWPLLALRRSCITSVNYVIVADGSVGSARIEYFEETGCLRLPRTIATKLAVETMPIAPILPGFAINTVFYAAVLWMLFALGRTPFALRKWRRIRRGQCPKCGYDLRGGATDSTTCPECGGSLLQKSRSSAP